MARSEKCSHEVEVHEDLGRGESRVEEDLGPVLERLDLERGVRRLLGNERGDVALEATGPDSHDDDGDKEQRERALLLRDDGGDGGNDEQEAAREKSGASSCVGS